LNPLFVGSVLFAIGGIVDALIGAATWVVTRVGAVPPEDTLLLNPAADRAMFGDSPQTLLANDASLALLYRLTFDLIGGLLFAFGILQVAIAWFALREGQAWALWALVIGDLAFVAGWALVINRYAGAAAPIIGGTILPPNLLVPLVLLLPAAVFAYVGLQGTPSL
jgi:hypothetical protein